MCSSLLKLTSVGDIAEPNIIDQLLRVVILNKLYALANSFKVNEVLQNGRTNKFTVKFCDAVDFATSNACQMGHSNLFRETLWKHGS